MNPSTIPVLADLQAKAPKRIRAKRLEVDANDDEIAERLVKRLRLVKEIGDIKSEAKLPVCDPSREATQIEHYAAFAEKNGVPAEQIVEPFRTIIRISKLFQRGTSLSDLRKRKFGRSQ